MRDNGDGPVGVAEQRMLDAACGGAVPADDHEVRAPGVAREHVAGMVMYHVAPDVHAGVFIPPWRQRLGEALLAPP